MYIYIITIIYLYNYIYITMYIYTYQYVYNNIYNNVYIYIYISVCILYIEVVGDDGPISLVANSQLCDTPNPSTPQWRNSPPATVWLLQRSPQCGSVRCCHRRQSRIPGCSHSHLHRPCNPQ